MDKYIGKRLDGRYEIHELLGVGGMAYVYKAYDNIEKRWVAIKILKEELAGNSDFLRRFRNESKAIAVLSHPNIVKVYDVSFGDRIQYIVMEYIDGLTLREFMEQGRLTPELARKFVQELCSALGYLHGKQIVHRDLKPENILVTYNGNNIKLIDFGLSDCDDYDVLKLPAGTRYYLAPEALKPGQPLDLRADIYSLGIILGEMAERLKDKRLAAVSRRTAIRRLLLWHVMWQGTIRIFVFTVGRQLSEHCCWLSVSIPIIIVAKRFFRLSIFPCMAIYPCRLTSGRS